MSFSISRDVAAVAALVAFACLVAGTEWRAGITWGSDAFFYRSHVLRVEGVPKAAALRRVFNGPLTARGRARESSLPLAQRRLSNPRWVSSTSRFFERRWVVPLVAAALDPLLGPRGLLAASLIGYVLIAPFLYLLLRLLFPVWIALGASAISLMLQPVRTWAGYPLTDSTGLAFECLALLSGLLVLSRGRRWLPLWAATVLVLSFTRDTSAIAVTAAVAVCAFRPTRTKLLLTLTGIAASLPAPIAFGVPLKEQMAHTLNYGYPVPHPTWTFIAHRYGTGVRSLVKQNLEWLGGHPVDAIVLVGGCIVMLLVVRRTTETRLFLFGAILGAVLIDLVQPNYTAFRLELIFVPFAALGLAAAAQVTWRRLGSWRPLAAGRFRSAIRS
jgi:hypothetical protein